MVHDLSLAPCADFRILATRHYQRIHVRIKDTRDDGSCLCGNSRLLTLGRPQPGRDKGLPSPWELSLAVVVELSTGALREQCAVNRQLVGFRSDHPTSH